MEDDGRHAVHVGMSTRARMRTRSSIRLDGAENPGVQQRAVELQLEVQPVAAALGQRQAERQGRGREGAREQAVASLLLAHEGERAVVEHEIGPAAQHRGEAPHGCGRGDRECHVHPAQGCGRPRAHRDGGRRRRELDGRLAPREHHRALAAAVGHRHRTERHGAGESETAGAVRFDRLLDRDGTGRRRGERRPQGCPGSQAGGHRRRQRDRQHGEHPPARSAPAGRAGKRQADAQEEQEERQREDGDQQVAPPAGEEQEPGERQGRCGERRREPCDDQERGREEEDELRRAPAGARGQEDPAERPEEGEGERDVDRQDDEHVDEQQQQRGCRQEARVPFDAEPREGQQGREGEERRGGELGGEEHAGTPGPQRRERAQREQAFEAEGGRDQRGDPEAEEGQQRPARSGERAHVLLQTPGEHQREQQQQREHPCGHRDPDRLACHERAAAGGDRQVVIVPLVFEPVVAQREEPVEESRQRRALVRRRRCGRSPRILERHRGNAGLQPRFDDARSIAEPEPVDRELPGAQPVRHARIGQRRRAARDQPPRASHPPTGRPHEHRRRAGPQREVENRRALGGLVVAQEERAAHRVAFAVAVLRAEEQHRERDRRHPLARTAQELERERHVEVAGSSGGGAVGVVQRSHDDQRVGEPALDAGGEAGRVRVPFRGFAEVEPRGGDPRLGEPGAHVGEQARLGGRTLAAGEERGGRGEIARERFAAGGAAEAARHAARRSRTASGRLMGGISIGGLRRPRQGSAERGCGAREARRHPLAWLPP